MSRGASRLVNPTSNASSPYVYPSPTNDLNALGLEERERRRYDFEAATKAKRLIDAKELVKEERRATERSYYLSYSDLPIFNLRSPSRSRSPSLNFLASYAVSTIEVL
ncbi:hypothetical protein D6D21_10777 [Aureobasidium pullulans]|uniref:Uncharacterized protein n=1 Tax=Aureobasidium pullulans TaxID=5580 RepID=A0AB74IHK8_AURPU|nr:hypothetical protein D6D21_10777 [Aureobasidium pullulans]